jgi:hypothetical protein
MKQIEIAHNKLLDLARMPLHYVGSISWTFKKAADNQGDSTRSGIILDILTWEQEQKNGTKLIQ